VRGGDRLPWIESLDNHAPLRALDWQAHVYGSPSPDVTDAAAARGLPVHIFDWTADARAAGLARDALYLVRPDGYVAFAARTARGLWATLDEVRGAR